MDIGSLTGRLELEDEMSDALGKANAALTQFGKLAASNIDVATAFGNAMTSVGTTLSYAVTAPIIAFGGAAVLAGTQVEGAYNTIARKTGETGVALAGLKKDFEAVFVTVPNSAEEVAAAIADVHQRLGLTGTELQGVTKKFLDFANVNQIDVADATRIVSTLMGALSENTHLTAAEIGNASGIMDKLTYASQQSGASVGKLAQGVIQGGLAFVEMGFGLDESLALFAQFEKVGANVTDVTASLHRTMGNLAKSGVTDLAGAFKSLVTEIKEAPTYADSVRLSIEAFGMRAGPKLAEEIRAGTYSIDEFAKTLKGLGSVTADTAKNSESFTESLGTLRNQVTIALAPIGIQLLDAMRKLLPLLTDAAKFVANLTSAFAELPDPVKAAAFGAVALVAAVGPLLAMMGPLITAVVTLAGPAALGALATAMSTALALLPAIGIAVAGVTAVVTAGYQAWKLYTESRDRAAAAERQAVTDQANLARAIKATGQEFKSMEEATAWMIKNDFAAKLRESQPAAEAAAKGIDLLKERMAKLRSEAMMPLTVETKSNIAELHKMKFSVEEIAKALGVSDQAVKLYVDALDDSAKAAKKAGENQKDLKELISKTNLEILAGMATWDDFTKKIEVSTKRISDSIISNDAIMRDSQNALNDLVHESMVERVTFELYQLDKLAYNTKLKLDENVANYKAASQAIDDLIARRKEMVRLADEIETSDDAFKGLGKNIDAVKEKWKQVGDTFGDVSSILDQLPGKFFEVASVAARTGAAIAKNLSEGDVFGAIVSGITGGITLIKQLFSDQNAAQVKKYNLEIDKLRENLLDTYGSLENLEVVSQRVGMSFTAEWGHQGATGLKQMNEFIKEFEARIEAVDAATKRLVAGTSAVVSALTEPWRKLGKEAEDAASKALKAYEEYQKALSDPKASSSQIDTLKDKYEEAFQASLALHQQLEAESAGAVQLLSDLGLQAIATFAAVYTATGSYSEALATIAPTVNELAEAYQALGIEADDVLLKNLMIQSQVLESSPQLIAAIDGQADALQGMAQMGLLNSDTFAAMQRTGTELYMRLQGETALAAAASGDLGDQTRNALLPMQKYLQQATIQAELLGLPLDENTQRLIDQSRELGIWKDAGATAQDKLIEGMQAIVTKLDELLIRLGAMTNQLSNMPDAHAVVTVDHIDRYQTVLLPDRDERGGVEHLAGGGMVPSGSDTVPAMLTPGERVLTVQQTEAYNKREQESSDTSSMEKMLGGIRDDLRRNNETLLISLQSVMAQTV